MRAEEIKNADIEQLVSLGSFECSCGKTHSSGTKRLIIERGAVKRLPELLRELGAKRPFVLSGAASFAAAGEAVVSVLVEAGVEYKSYVFPSSPVPPTEQSVGSAVMHFDSGCDAIISVGSGVMNDIGKLLAGMTGKPYIIVASAPSMDGFASASSSMEMDGLKVSLNSSFAWAIVGDIDILSMAPMHMLCAGVGDMLAKYISLAEWRIANIVVGEYYCPVIATLVETALEKVVGAADKLIARDSEAVKAVMDGMVIAGMAMKYAGLSRPASGMEHYFSHIWDMRALEFDEAKADLHGIQCAMGTLLSLRVYEFIKKSVPDKAKALEYAKSFDRDDWNRQLREFIGRGAEAMIACEAEQGKYNASAHAKRLERIIDKWDEILAVINTLPSYDEVRVLTDKLGIAAEPSYLGYTHEDTVKTFVMTKDIRDKYIGSRLLWDIGLIDEAEEFLLEQL